MNPDYCIPRGWKWGGGILIPYFPSLSPQYRTPNVCHLYPEYRFLSDFGESRFPSSGQFPYRVKKFGVFPNPACVSSRIPFQTLYIPVYRFLSKSCIRAQILENLLFRRSSQIPYPVNVSRILHCISVKSRSLGIPL